MHDEQLFIDGDNVSNIVDIVNWLLYFSTFTTSLVESSCLGML
jgi:hypothetical protein